MRALALAALAVTATAAPLTLMKHHERHVERRRGAALAAHGEAPLPPAQFFSQVLSHFDGVVAADPTKMWPQRFWVNSTFFNGNGPVFLYVEGEGAGSAADVVGGQHVELAADMGALIVALEHRFFGASTPTPDLSLNSLRYLATPEAIGDVARFITEYLIPTFKLDLSVNKIVSFGGSYPGALSAWLRLKLPHLIHTSFSTSSPVLAELDFQGYNNVVAASLANPAVGGSPQCLAAVTSAFDQVNTALSGGANSRAAISKALLSCEPVVTDLDAQNFASNIAGQIMGVVQYNNEPGSTFNINNICSIMLGGQQPIVQLAKVINATLGAGTTCMDNLYSDAIAQLANTTVDPTATGVGVRQWAWLTIQSYAYYQTCDAGTSCPFTTSYMPLSFSIQQGLDAYGPQFTLGYTTERVAFTNAFLGATNVDVPRILFTNGGIDPWHALSVTPTVIDNPAQASVWIPTGAHCRQMFPSTPSDPADVIAARAEAAAYLKAWLKEPYVPGSKGKKAVRA